MIFPFFLGRKFKSRADVKNALRDFLLDTKAPNAYEASLDLGCLPLSLDVLEKAEDESDKRVDKIAHLLPNITSYAVAYSDAVLSRVLDKSEELPDELEGPVMDLLDKFHILIEESMGNVMIGAISQLVDTKQLLLPRKK